MKSKYTIESKVCPGQLRSGVVTTVAAAVSEIGTARITIIGKNRKRRRRERDELARIKNQM